MCIRTTRCRLGRARQRVLEVGEIVRQRADDRLRVVGPVVASRLRRRVHRDETRVPDREVVVRRAVHALPWSQPPGSSRS